MSNNPLALNIVEFQPSDLLDSLKLNDNECQVPLTVLFERKIDGVEYIYAIYNSYLAIIAKNELTGNYLSIGPDNIENLLIKIITNEKDDLLDALDTKSSKQITIEGNILYMFDVLESAKGTNAFTDESGTAKLVPLNEYKVELTKMIGKAIKSDKLANVSWSDYSSTLKEMLIFGKDNRPEINEEDVELSYVDIAITYFLQLVFVDRIVKMQWVLTNIAKTISTDD